MQAIFWLIDLGYMDKILDKAPHLLPCVKSLIIICYAAITFSAVIYCLSLWMGLNLALVARLSGLVHASKAFFLSLALLFLTVPWLRIFDLEFPAVLFTYEQVTDAYSKICSQEEFGQRIIYYIRFVAFCVLAIIMLIAAQSCSSQAGKMINHSIARYAERGQTPPPEPTHRL